jgi:hypothetical protein
MIVSSQIWTQTGGPQTGRNKALKEIRKAWAPHLCGDQHLAVVVQHGIDNHRDGPFAFTSPAIVNSIYGRWWHPLGDKPGKLPIPNSPLPGPGIMKTGLEIKSPCMPTPTRRQTAGMSKTGQTVLASLDFNKKNRTITYECWPRFGDVSRGKEGSVPRLAHNPQDETK